jgi:glutamine amidotransferase/cyclase
MYFVHSFCAKLEGGSVPEWLLTRTSYGHDFISSIRRGALVATQFHPEKSGESGLRFISNFLLGRPLFEFTEDSTEVGLAKRIIACLDVRSNDAGDLVGKLPSS